jgi:hypothetical protein
MTPGLVAAASDEAIFLSKTLSKFLSEVYVRQKAVLIDLGPAIGSNISYLAERIGCKIHVGDLYADLDRHAREGMFNRLPEFLERRFSLSNGSVDAVLCWEVFDYLGPAAGAVLAGELIRLLRPGGLLLGFFAARPSEDTRYAKYFIEDESRLPLPLLHEGVPAAWGLAESGHRQVVPRLAAVRFHPHDVAPPRGAVPQA